MTVPTFRIIQGTDLSPRQHEAVLDVCSRAYDMDFAPLLHTFFEPVHVLAYVDEVLVSHALWVTRWLQYDNSVMLRAAYVEAVATAPAYQRRGFATAVMRVLQDSIRDFDVGALSPSDAGWYIRLGWELWRGPLFIRMHDHTLATPAEEVMILRLPRTPALDLNAPLSAEWRQGELW